MSCAWSEGQTKSAKRVTPAVVAAGDMIIQLNNIDTVC